MRTSPELLQRLTALHGTASAVGALFGVPANTVRVWRSRNEIPARYRAQAERFAYPAPAPAPAPAPVEPQAPELEPAPPQAADGFLVAYEAARARPRPPKPPAEHPLLAGLAVAARTVEIPKTRTYEYPEHPGRSWTLGAGREHQLADTTALEDLCRRSVRDEVLEAWGGLSLLRYWNGPNTGNLPWLGSEVTLVLTVSDAWRCALVRGDTEPGPGPVASSEWIRSTPCQAGYLVDLIRRDVARDGRVRIGSVADVDRLLLGAQRHATIPEPQVAL